MGSENGGCGGCSRRDALKGLSALAFTWAPLSVLSAGCDSEASDPADAQAGDASGSGGSGSGGSGSGGAGASGGSGSGGTGGGGGPGDASASAVDAAETPDAAPSQDAARPPSDAALPEPDAAPPDAAPPDPDAAPPPEQCAGNVCIDLSDPMNADLRRVGGSGFVETGGDTVIVMHDTADAYITLSAVCTHRGCRIGYRPDSHDLRCGCHGAMYTLDGAVTQGPAPDPLRVYRNELIGRTLVIYLV